jgi:hypothetical protein
MNFWIHIVPSQSPVGPRYMFSVANMAGPGGAAPYVTFETLDTLTASLRSIHVDEMRIVNMREKLAIGKPDSLPDVYLTDENLRQLGFYVLGNVPERVSAISAVEELKLGSKGANRLERSRGLPPEERRAETIQAFAQLRDRE